MFSFYRSSVLSLILDLYPLYASLCSLVALSMTIVHVAYNGLLQTTKTATAEETFDKNDPCFQRLFYIGACCAKAVFDQNDLEANPDQSIDERKVNGDASEAGILKFSQKIEDVMEYRSRNTQVMTIPFNSSNKFMITCNKIADSPGQLRICMKGAPERVMDRCTTFMTSNGVVEFDAAKRDIVNEQLAHMMDRGERVLGFGCADLDPVEYPIDYEFDTESKTPNFPMDGFTFVGLMALLDPPREAVPDAVKTCQAAGVKVVMVTGDHPATAKSIAKQVHIIRDLTQEDIARERGVAIEDIDPADVKSIVVPGSKIKDLEEADWDRILAHDQIVFARTSPQQKLIIVENNQRLGNIVAVTGDGVNDSPALKKANVGIAMGISGSDVSKEAADMILLDDNFASIVSGVEEGRLIFDNLKKTIAYTLISNIPEIMPFIVFVILGIPPPLTTVLILCIDLGTDMLPAISLAYENAEADIMQRQPRDSRVDRLVNRRLISFSYFQIGVIEALAGFYAYTIVLGDYGWKAQFLPGLDGGKGYLSSQGSEDRRWLYSERKRVGGESMKLAWFHNPDGGDAPFKEFFTSDVPGFVRQTTEIFEQLLPTDGGDKESPATPATNAQFQNMVKAIGSVTGRPSCAAFSCALGRNDPDCFTAPGAITVTTADLVGSVTNPKVIEGTGQGEGCFELWSESQQNAVLKHSQTAFLASIVVVQIGNLLGCRTRLLSFFKQSLWHNRVLMAGIASEITLLLLLFYVPPISSAFGTKNIRAVHWLPAIPFAIFIFCYDESRKHFMRVGDKTGNKFGVWVRANTYW
jgi:magnesium-transporting ATPase (P-type)